MIMKTHCQSRLIIFISIFWIFSIFSVHGQSPDSIHEQFTIIKQIPTTPVKNQYKTITCWSFAVMSMLESELIQSGKGEVDLSEMYVVRQAYIEKAERYVRMHGSINFGGGGALNDPIDIIRKYGILPNNVYSGLKEGSTNHNHIEMDAGLKDYVIGLIKNKKLSLSWKEGFIGILDAYLGKVPEKFLYNNKEYTPLSYSKMLGIDPDNYILLTSFMHHPFYQKFIIEVPDNWSWGQAYNLPLNELQKVIDYSLDKGYSVAIACDMTEKGFMWKKGIALTENLTENDNDKNINPNMWVPNNDSTQQTFKEVSVTPQLRQDAFDNYETTDDHDFQIVGIAKDQNGKKFYIAKNSWGTEGTDYGGFLYLSESYLLYKTLTVLVNKKAIPSDILKKPGLQ